MGPGLCAGVEGRQVGAEAAAPQTRCEVVIIQGAAITSAPHGHTGLASRVIMPGLNIETRSSSDIRRTHLAILVCFTLERAVCPLLDGVVSGHTLGISILFLQSGASVKHSYKKIYNSQENEYISYIL